MIDQTRIDQLRVAPVSPGQHIINGKAVASASGATLDVVAPIDGTVLTQIAADTGGFYFGPTLFDNATQASALVQNEVFGPALYVQPFDTEDAAVEMANGTAYGLAVGVFTRDISRAHRMVARLHAGGVHVNTYGGADVSVPLGGHGQSGNGHDKSPHALDRFRTLKTAWIQ